MRKKDVKIDGQPPLRPTAHGRRALHYSPAPSGRRPAIAIPVAYKIFSSGMSSIIGKESIGNNIPYKRFQKALKALNLGNNGYTQYSFKQLSNINRLNNGWTLAEIMKANRQSSIFQTEKYLKDITRVTDISNKEIPVI